MLLSLLQLVLVLQYLISSSLTVVNTLVAVHLMEPAINRCLKGTLHYVILESSTSKEDFYLLQTFLISLIL